VETPWRSNKEIKVPRKVWTAGDVLAAADVNTYLGDQVISVFADATARDAAITVPVHGMACYLQDTNALLLYDSSAWVGLDTLPDQTGQANNYLTTNGTTASWAAIVTDPNPQIFMMMGA
jgi:hypothetical protein